MRKIIITTEIIGKRRIMNNHVVVLNGSIIVFSRNSIEAAAISNTQLTYIKDLV